MLRSLTVSIIIAELEKALIEESVKVEEIPELWNEKMTHYLGILLLLIKRDAFKIFTGRSQLLDATPHVYTGQSTYVAGCYKSASSFEDKQEQESLSHQEAFKRADPPL